LLDFFQRLGGKFGRTRDDMRLISLRELGVRLGKTGFEFGEKSHAGIGDLRFTIYDFFPRRREVFSR